MKTFEYEAKDEKGVVLATAGISEANASSFEGWLQREKFTWKRSEVVQDDR